MRRFIARYKAYIIIGATLVLGVAVWMGSCGHLDLPLPEDLEVEFSLGSDGTGSLSLSRKGAATPNFVDPGTAGIQEMLPIWEETATDGDWGSFTPYDSPGGLRFTIGPLGDSNPLPDLIYYQVANSTLAQDCEMTSAPIEIPAGTGPMKLFFDLSYDLDPAENGSSGDIVAVNLNVDTGSGWETLAQLSGRSPDWPALSWACADIPANLTDSQTVYRLGVVFHSDSSTVGNGLAIHSFKICEISQDKIESAQ